MTIIVMNPAAETAAAVSSPLIAVATESPARISRTISIRTKPNWVFNMLIIPPVIFSGIFSLPNDGYRAKIGNEQHLKRSMNAAIELTQRLTFPAFVTIEKECLTTPSKQHTIVTSCGNGLLVSKIMEQQVPETVL